MDISTLLVSMLIGRLLFLVIDLCKKPQPLPNIGEPIEPKQNYIDIIKEITC